MSENLPSAQLDALIQVMEKALCQSGFFHTRSPVSAATFEYLSHSLGPVCSDFSVRVIPESGDYVCKAGEVPFHNDDRHNRFMSWHCLRQDLADGASLLLPVDDLFKHFSPEELFALRRVRIKPPYYASVKGRETAQPLVFASQSGLGTCFSPWLRMFCESDAEANAARKFAKLTRELFASEDAIRVRLQEGECLVIDNHRLMHGRKAISEDSPRRLRRLWIGSPPDDQR